MRQNRRLNAAVDGRTHPGIAFRKLLQTILATPETLPSVLLTNAAPRENYMTLAGTRELTDLCSDLPL